MEARDLPLLYRLPLYVRYVNVGNCDISMLKKVCLNIDDMGLFVYYKYERQLDIDFIKKYKFQIGEAVYTVEAKACNIAIYCFLTKKTGAQIGGELLHKKALWINKSKAIIELPRCPFMRKSKGNRFVCGEPIEDDDIGEFGMCVIEGYKSPDYCTLAEYNRRISDKKSYKEYLKFADNVFGYKVIRSKQVPLEFNLPQI